MAFTPQDFGARADGVAKDTAAVQAAIDAAGAAACASHLAATPSRGCGPHVVFPPGTYLCGALRLRSGVELRLERGARLLASPDIADFPDWPDAKHVVAANCARARNAAFIFADECENIAITGGGIIDGNGEHHVRRKTAPDWIGWEFERIYPMEQSLPRVVFFAGCRDVRVEGVSLVNGPAGWGWWIHDCDRVAMRGLTIRSDVRYPNNDGIHVNCSRDVEISDCDIECGDDALVIRANSRSLAENRPCERVHAHDCRVRSWASGIRVGWCNDGVIRDCSFRRISMRDTTNGIDIVLPTMPDNPDYGREATLIEDILFEDIDMDGLYCHPLDAKIDPDPRTRVEAVRRITLRRIRAKALEPINVMGRADAPFRDFRFEDCHFESIPEEDIDSGAVAWGGTIPARDWRRHGAAYAGRTHPARSEGHEGFVFKPGAAAPGTGQPGAAAPGYIKHSMLRRCLNWDYRQPCIYQITLTLADRASRALGRLVVDADGMAAGAFDPAAVEAHVEPSAAGAAVMAQWQGIATHHPDVRPLLLQIMPDHVHFILHVTRQMERPLGQIIAGFKTGTSKAATGKPGLWAEGYQDTILFHEGQLDAMFAYLRDNPRRLAVKRLAPRLFQVRRDLALEIPALPRRAQDNRELPLPAQNKPGFTAHFCAIGNEALLRAPQILQVQCSRADFAYRREPKAGHSCGRRGSAGLSCSRRGSAGFKLARDAAGAPLCAKTTPAFEEKCAQFLAAARHGTVLVSPCVSDGEREIARRAFEAGASVIALRNMGFSPLYKPGGRLFDRAANGNLLLLAPAAWPYSTAEKPMTRADACAMNRIAQWIAGPGAAEIRYHGIEPRDVERMAREAARATAVN